jgi:hypothetical protein
MFAKKYNVQVESVSVSADAASITHDQHLATILCEECHHKDLGGELGWFSAGPIGTGDTPNLTAGAGGLGSEFSDADFVRVLRHGVKPQGTSVFIMPAQDFYHLSDKDLGDLIAYIRTVPAVDRQTPEPHVRLSFFGNVMYGAGIFGDVLRVDRIDQTTRPTTPPPGITPEYGENLVNINGVRVAMGGSLLAARVATPVHPRHQT